MKLKYSDIELYYKSLRDIGDLKLPRAIRVAISRNLIIFEQELQTFLQQREEILKQYSERDTDGNPVIEQNSAGQVCYKIDAAQTADYTREMEELYDIEIDINVIKAPSSLFDLCDESDRYDVPTANQEAAISWMID